MDRNGSRNLSEAGAARGGSDHATDGIYPGAYRQYLVHFHRTRDFFECHEILEEYWKEAPDSPYGETWVGLIQLAVGLYHHRRGNWRGAAKMLQSARGKLAEGKLSELGIDEASLLSLVEERLVLLSCGERAVYRDLDIPLTDPALWPLVQPAADSRELGPDIIDRHILRDRSEVIAARQAALEKRRARQGQGRPQMGE